MWLVSILAALVNLRVISNSRRGALTKKLA